MKRWVIKAIVLLVALNIVYYIIELLCAEKDIPWHRLFVSIIEGGVISAPLWYLSSLWEGLLIMWLMLKISRKLLILCPLSYIVVYSVNQLYFHIPTGLYCNWEEYAMSITRAMCFLSIGYIMAWKNFKNLYSVRWDIIIFILSFVALKSSIAKFAPLYYFWVVTEGAGLFAMALKADRVRCRWMESIGKYHSANIYYFHAFIIAVYNFVSFHVPCLKLNNNLAIPIFILTLMSSLCINAIWNTAKKVYNGA